MCDIESQEVMNVDECMDESQVVVTAAPVVAEQLPSVVKSHLPPHLVPRGMAHKKPLNDSTITGVNTSNASTPAVVKRRQMNKWFNSPTDAFLSPCTQKLMKPKHESQQHIEPLDLDEKHKQDMDVENDVLDVHHKQVSHTMGQ